MSLEDQVAQLHRRALCFLLKYLYLKQIRLLPKSPRRTPRPDRSVGILPTPDGFWVIAPTTGYVGPTELRRRQPPRGVCHESLRFPLFSSIAQEAGNTPVRGDDDEEVPAMRR